MRWFIPRYADENLCHHVTSRTVDRHELRFTDQTASHWLIKNKTPVMKQTDYYVYLLSLSNSALSVNQKYHMYTVSNQKR